MHIAFRTSGGRGEYEVVGGTQGASALDLEGWTFHMRWPDGLTRDTGLWLDPADSGKPRLRSLHTPAYQIGRMVSAMLLLPAPRHALRGAADDLPVARRNQYLVTQIGWGADVELASPPDQVRFYPNYVQLSNAVFSDLMGVDARWQRVVTVYGAAAQLPDSVRQHLLDHEATLASGEPITQSLNTRVNQLMKALVSVAPGYVPDHDPLPALEALLGVTPAGGPDLPPPDDLGENEAETRVQSAIAYRLARTRGPSARAFAERVKVAYNHRCAFCGLRLGDLEGVVSGIDAAHILAWSKYDLDVVKNGIALCKLHHWAFDAALMLPVVDSSGRYGVTFTELAARLDPADRARLGEDGQAIPDNWLPADKADRPSPKYLRRLYDDLGVAF